MSHTLNYLWKDEGAQGATEYILMLVIVIVIGIAMLFKNSIMGIIRGKVQDIDNSIQNFSPEG